MILLMPLLVSWILGALFLALDGRKRWVNVAACVVLGAVLVLNASLLLGSGPGSSFTVTAGDWPPGIGIRLRVDTMSLLFATVCSFVLAAVMIHEARADVHSRIFPALLLLLSGGLHGAFFTGDLFNFYVFFELAMVTSFALAAYGYGRAEVRGAFIYIAVNLVGSVLFLIGIAGIYHEIGTLDLQQLAERIGRGEGRAMILPASMLFAALSVKLGLFPFHSWVPVLYSHARPAVASAMTGALVNLGSYGMLRFGLTMLAGAREQSAIVLITLGAVAALYGGVLGIRRKRPAEITAYASIAHAGFVVFGLGVGGAHGVAAVLLAVIAGSIDKSAMLLSIESAGAGRAAALVAAASVAGLPVTIGFVFKLQLFRAAIEAPGAWIVVPALLASSVLLLSSAFRFRRLAHQESVPERDGGRIPLLFAGVIVLLGAWPEPALQLAQRLALELIGGAG